MKKIIILLLLLLVTVNAQMNMMPAQAGPGNPMPNYMPLIMENAEEVAISPEQKAELEAWSAVAGPMLSAWTKELQEINLKINKAALDGLSLDELLRLEQNAEELRLKMVTKKVDCRDNAIKILDKKQWQQVIGLYNMSQVGTAKKEIYSPMPELGMSLMMHSGDLNLDSEQAKIVADLPNHNMPGMQALENDISSLYALMTQASLELKSKAEILQLENNTEAKRIELISSQADCRNQILEILNEDQWHSLLDFHNNMASMNQDMGAMDHDHDDSNNMADHDHNMAAMAEQMGDANILTVGNNTLRLEPIVSNKQLYLGLNFSQMEMGEIDFMITSPNAKEHKTLKLSNVNLLELGQVQTGIWRFAGKLHEEEINFSISVAHQETEYSDVYLILAPSPSLSGAGKSEAFVYAFKDAASVHSSLNIKRNMPGMQHSSDHDELAMLHSHFENRYNNILADAMANQSPISFMMVGNWEVEVNIAGETSESILFTIEMLDE